MITTKKQKKSVRVVYDISLDGTFVVAGGAEKHPVISNTDG